MSGEEKPYRVYRGGRQKGKVPIATRPPRPPARARTDGGGSAYPGPGPVEEKRRWSWGRRIAVGLAVLLLLVIAWAVASYFSIRGGVADANKRLPAGTTKVLDHQNSLLLSTPTNVLLLGSDRANQPGHQDTQHSDSIMLIRTDPSRNRITYLSIPRDLRVPIPGIGDAKINAAMESGGAPLAIRTIRAYTGLQINHVITVDFAQFRDVIDAVGGINVYVPEDIISKFDCPLKTDAECAKWKGWHFAKGVHHFDGRRGLVYARVRKNILNPADTDITRTERQQDVLQAILRKMTAFSTLVKLPFIGGRLVKPLSTDLSTWQFMQLGWLYKRGSVVHCRLGGTPTTLPDGEDVLVAEGDDKERVLLTVLGKEAPLPPRPGEHMYGAGCVTGNQHFPT
jgi:LCP family protein required for cell wall assembly